MQDRQRGRDPQLDHRIWFGVHPPVYTLGQAADPQHLLNPQTSIPILTSDRGGQITYHGPGQLMFYTLLNLHTLGWGIRRLVMTLENLLIQYLAQHQLKAHSRREAPGVYLGEDKIASVGLRVSHGHSYHGMAINVDMDLSPFQHINPCGHAKLQMTQLREHGIHTTPEALGSLLSHALAKQMGTPCIPQPWDPSPA